MAELAQAALPLQLPIELVVRESGRATIRQ